MLRNKKFQLILSLVVAIALWFYVVGNVNPEITETLHDIPVEKTGEDVLEELGMSAALEGPESVDIVIRGSRSDVNEVKREDVSATVDVSNCDYGENEEEIQIEFADDISGVAVDSISEEKARFNVE